MGGPGDFDGDGHADLLITAGGANGQSGRAYVYPGGVGGPATLPTVTLAGVAGGSEFGFSARTAGDVDGDGYDEAVVGAKWNNTGIAYAFFGKAIGLDATTPVPLLPTSAPTSFGFAVAAAGDLDGDGLADVLVATPGGDFGLKGAVYVYSGAMSGFGATPAASLIEPGCCNQGFVLVDAGDFFMVRRPENRTVFDVRGPRSLRLDRLGDLLLVDRGRHGRG